MERLVIHTVSSIQAQRVLSDWDISKYRIGHFKLRHIYAWEEEELEVKIIKNMSPAKKG